MNLKHAGLAAIATAALLSVPAFAQSASTNAGVSSGTGGSVSSGTGAAVNSSSGPSSSSMSASPSPTANSGTATSSDKMTGDSHMGSSSSASTTTTTTTPGGASASVTVTPSTSVAVETAPHLLPGGVMAPMASTTVLGGPAANVSGSQTVVTRYWVNVPAHVERRADFQRWQHLK